MRFHNPRYERIVRLNTESIARKMGFDEERIFDISLAVEEAYTNAIEHSGRHLARDGEPAGEPPPPPPDPETPRGEALMIEIVYHLFPDRLEVTIQDTGCGFCDWETPAPPDAFALDRPNPDRGRGLALIRELSDSVDILSEPGAGTMIRICKRL